MVIAGGGTGGHVFPGIAIAEELKMRDAGAAIFFIGTEQGIESKIIPKEGYPLRFITAEGFVGKSPLKRLRAAFMMLGAVAGSRRLLKALKPDIVIGTGGYASAAPVAVACLMSIPTLITEQNLVPGLANKLLGRFVDAVAVTYHESISFFPKSKTHLTGNPIRQGILKGQRAAACRLFSLEEDRFTIFISGGSSGARSINNAAVNALRHLADLRDGIQFLHQTGESDFEDVRKAYRKLGFRGTAAPFIHRMAEAYAAADLVVSRAGATTLAELTALGKPAILIPYPHAAGHQEFNAVKLQKAGACRMIRDAALSGGVLAAAIKEIYSSEGLRSEMRAQGLAMGRPDAAQKVVDIAQSLVNLKKPGKSYV
ncbi:MAG: undecaprenyldiphospho-muramoylpentapeptide beta-N-acetylglucosaminyltransferase [Thermodesulfovibrionales bacterium]|nr:undecaprenyldiphospho-muramoylpentapeptide beta-N-acetylglucosaminyltransferase [Thermodesulfovibrionales bacterium]